MSPIDHSTSSDSQTVKIFGKSGSAAAFAIRDFLHRSGIPYEWHEVRDRNPVCVLADGRRLESPTIRQITEALGWYHDPSRSEYDLAIYGAGPAGLSAAVYGASDGLKTIVIERSAIGGQAASSPKIENYLGFPSGISGAELAERAREQACRFGAEILVARAGVRGEFSAGKRIGYLEDGTKVVARTAICATGVEYRRLDLPGEQKLRGAGVYYGAGASEAELCANEHVVIVGGGNSAAQAASQFARFAQRVTMAVRGGSLNESVSAYLVDRILASEKIEVLTDSEVTAIHGDETLNAVTIANRTTGEARTIETTRLFVCIGGAPRTEWANEAGIQRDAGGYLLTGPDLAAADHRPRGWPLDRDPYYLETNVPGLFAAGDVRHGSIKRCASAVGEGAMAVALVHRYLMGG